MSSGYFEDAGGTATSFTPNSRLRTGDIGILDYAGGLRLVGRVKEIINRGGEKIAPAEIDAALLKHPAVVEAAAFSIPATRLGEEVAAAVVLHPGSAATERDLRRHVARLLAPSKVSRRIWFVDELPRTMPGKGRRGDLADRFGSAPQVDAGG